MFVTSLQLRGFVPYDKMHFGSGRTKRSATQQLNKCLWSGLSMQTKHSGAPSTKATRCRHCTIAMADAKSAFQCIVNFVSLMVLDDSSTQSERCVLFFFLLVSVAGPV